MQEIKCPNCGEVFQVDEKGYSQIVQQVRDKEFEKELVNREKQIVEKLQSDYKLESLNQEKSYEKSIIDKEKQINDLKSLIDKLNVQLENSQQLQKAEVDKTIAKADQDKLNALAKKEEELTKKDLQIQELKAQLANAADRQEVAIAEAVNKNNELKNKELNNKNDELTKLKLENVNLVSKIEAAENQKQLAISNKEMEMNKKIAAKDNLIVELNGKLENAENEKIKNEMVTKDYYEAQLKMKDEQIEQYKDFKARQSTKMIGESLEVYCHNKFNEIRMTAFSNAYFEKDNDAKTGSKGDFIFRDFVDNIEYISIMFEMKNEADTTATKHKNEDFFKELDKDRKEKGCEYAVLVSMLEADNDFYNNGIVDVSYKYPKMYVIRPQFFITMITLLRNAALNSLESKRQLQIVKSQQLDINNFEDNMQKFKDGFSRNYDLAKKKFDAAIEDIEKTIKVLEKTKADLQSSSNNLRLANEKAQDLSIKKLTKNAPSVKAMFEQLDDK